MLPFRQAGSGVEKALEKPGRGWAGFWGNGGNSSRVGGGGLGP